MIIYQNEWKVIRKTDNRCITITGHWCWSTIKFRN